MHSPCMKKSSAPRFDQTSTSSSKTNKEPLFVARNMPSIVEKVPLFVVGDKPSLVTGVVGFVAGLFLATCKATAPFSLKWIASIQVLLLSSYTIARSLNPSNDSIVINKEAFYRIFAAHLFSATALPLLTAMLHPLMKTNVQVSILLFSMTLIFIGSMSEIVGHFRDRWEFVDGCHASEGTENFIFSISLSGGFSFLAAAFAPTSINIGLACVPVLALFLAKWMLGWKGARVIHFSTTMITSGTANFVLIRQMSSLWPLLYFVQAINIIRNAKLLLKTENQHLHLLPSVYGWFSYTVPFALALNPFAKFASLPVVTGVGMLTVFASNHVEQLILKNHENPIKNRCTVH